MIDTDRLNREIARQGSRKDKIASDLKISRQSLSNKINNRTAFKAHEVLYLKGLLGLSPESCMAIFFKRTGDSKSPKGA